MSGSEQTGHEQPFAAANSFNISDGLAAGEEGRGGGGAGKRSPSPSAVSTASSGSPLIRSGSSTSSASVGGASANSHIRQHSSIRQQAGPPRRPAPTSIAAAQLQQQGLQLDGAMHAQKCPASGNKLAHMARLHAKGRAPEQAADYRLGPSSGEPQREKPKKKKKLAQSGPADESGKSFGYNLGKTLAFRANRFNEFWSVNKMRYMNLACLLMTLVCLVTILLFSKSTITTTTTTKPAPAVGAPPKSGPLPQQQQSDERLKGRHRILYADLEGDDEQEAPGESINSLDRQALVRAPAAAKKSHSASADDRDELASGQEDSPTRATNSDGFNLFDERHEDSAGDSPPPPPPPSSSKRSLDDLLQDARRQLRRQQENEQEAESTEAASQNRSPQEADGPGKRPAGGGSPAAGLDPISQALQDLDGFGLFKSIKSRLVDQLERQNLSARAPPTIMRTKSGATIVMSFSSEPPTSSNGSTTTNSSTGSSANDAPEALPGFLRDLLPPMLGPASAASSSLLSERRPAGFAAITINSEPTVSIRSSPFPFGGFDSSPLGGPFSMGAVAPLPSPFGLALSPFLSAPSHRPLVMFNGGGGGGLMSMLMRATSELANQMRQQLDGQADNQTAQAPANGTLKPEASQQVKVIQLFGGGAADVAPEFAKNDSKSANSTTTTTKAIEDEVETLNLGRLFAAPPRSLSATFRLPPLAPFQSVYSTVRRSTKGAPLGAAGSMMMIESASGGAPSTSIISGESSGGPFGGPTALGSASPIGPFEIGGSAGPTPFMPRPFGPPGVFFMGGDGGGQRTRGFPEPATSPFLRSILGSFMSDLAQSMQEEGPAGRKPAQPQQQQQAASSSKASRRDDNNQDENDWDELEPQKGKSRARPRALADQDLMGDSSSSSSAASSGGDAAEPSRAGSQEGPFKFPAGASHGGGSLFEQMLEGLSGAGLGRPPHAFGTIRQTIRGPNGLTVERVIGLPPKSGGSRALHEQRLVQLVPPGVRSQSLSRMDSAPDTNSHMLRPFSPFARLFGGDTEHPDSDKSSSPSSPMSFIGQLLGQDLAAERHDELSESLQQPHGFRAHIASLRPQARRNPSIDQRSDGADPDSDDEQQFWSRPLPPVRVATARIRLVNPRRSDSGPAPLHFRLMANQASGADDEREPPPPQHQQSGARLAASPFTSPSSPLFGFPVLKTAQAGSAAAVVPSPVSSQPAGPVVVQQQHEVASSLSNGEPRAEREQQQQADSGEPSMAPVASGHRRQRSFVHHSNHEVAQSRARVAQTPPRGAQVGASPPPVEQRSAGPQQQQQQQQQPKQQAAALPPAASAVMGRRLDDFI